jgi:hypothetical protein
MTPSASVRRTRRRHRRQREPDSCGQILVGQATVLSKLVDATVILRSGVFVTTSTHLWRRNLMLSLVIGAAVWVTLANCVLPA